MARLLGGVRPHLMVTDPPYGVDYDPDWRNRAGASQTKRTGKVMNDDRADWREAWALFPGDVAYVWHGALHAATVADSLTASGFAIRSPDHLGQGAAGAVAGPLPLAARTLLVCGAGQGHGPLVGRPQADDAVADRERRTRTAATVHGTQKPVECMRRPILNNSSAGQAVYEPFCGSGTTLIAAETTGRICHAMELDPAYVDVAVQRWQAFTGKEAVLEGGGQLCRGGSRAEGRGWTRDEQWQPIRARPVPASLLERRPCGHVSAVSSFCDAVGTCGSRWSRHRPAGLVPRPGSGTRWPHSRRWSCRCRLLRERLLRS